MDRYAGLDAYAIPDEKLILIGLRPLHATGGIRIGICFLTVTATSIRTIAAFMLIPVDIRPYRSGVDAGEHGLQKVIQFQGLRNEVEENGVEKLGAHFGAKMTEAAMDGHLFDARNTDEIAPCLTFRFF